MVTSYQSAEAGEELLLHERLRNVVVGAKVETGDAIIDRVARGQHHDGRPLGVAQAAEHLAAIHDRHEVVEHDGVIITFHRFTESFLTIGSGVGGITFLAEQLQ